MLKANLLSDNYTGSDKVKLLSSLQKLETTMNSDKFKSAILDFDSFWFRKVVSVWKFRLITVPLQSFTNQQVLDRLLSGRGTWDGDTLMNLQLVLAEESGGPRVIGETDAKTGITTTYRDAFNGMSEADLANHLVHEWTHVLGFQHSFSDMKDDLRNCFSVPYAVGNLVQILIDNTNEYNCNYSWL